MCSTFKGGLHLPAARDCGIHHNDKTPEGRDAANKCTPGEERASLKVEALQD